MTLAAHPSQKRLSFWYKTDNSSTIFAMVNRGRSKGCVTCKQRRVKCDEAKPECGLCERLGLRCGGYSPKCAQRLVFKDQTHKFVRKGQARHKTTENALVRTPSPRSAPEPDTAVAFFLGQYAGQGRETASARGLFEILIPAYNSQPKESSLALAVSATAKMVLSLWRYGPRGLAVPHTAYTEAVSSVLKTLQNERARKDPTTVIAIVMLQIYENVVAVYNLRPATRMHQSGAVSLLPYLATDKTTNAGKNIRRFVFHTEIASAIREKKPLDSRLGIANTHGSNPSSMLDAIGAEVALLQASHTWLRGQNTHSSGSRSAVVEHIQEARRIDGHLLAWQQSVPAHWRPRRLGRHDMDWSIPTYQDTCEIYTTCQVAAIWNLWRVQRLILATIIADSHQRLQGVPVSMDTGGEAVQELVDGICYSVPFYLGNRSKPMSLSDFTDSSISYPTDTTSYTSEFYTTTTRSEHTSHIIPQGPWHMLSPLSRLLSLFADGSGLAIAPFVRIGQLEWVREQFLRVTLLLHISSVQGKYAKPRSRALTPEDERAETEMLAKVVRSGLRFMSGS